MNLKWSCKKVYSLEILPNIVSIQQTSSLPKNQVMSWLLLVAHVTGLCHKLLSQMTSMDLSFLTVIQGGWN